MRGSLNGAGRSGFGHLPLVQRRVRFHRRCCCKPCWDLRERSVGVTGCSQDQRIGLPSRWRTLVGGRLKERDRPDGAANRCAVEADSPKFLAAVLLPGRLRASGRWHGQLGQFLITGLSGAGRPSGPADLAIALLDQLFGQQSLYNSGGPGLVKQGRGRHARPQRRWPTFSIGSSWADGGTEASQGAGLLIHWQRTTGGSRPSG